MLHLHLKLQQYLWLLLTFLTFSCKTDYQNLPAYTETRHWQAVVETPAGSVAPLRYNAQENSFDPVVEAGQPRKLDFLPYVGNQGFIPSTLVDTAAGKEGYPLPVLVLSDRQEPGTVQEILPVAVLITERESAWHHLIIAVPARPSEQTISPTSYSDFSARYPVIKNIIQQWYLAENPFRPTHLVGWRDEAFAEKLIQRWVN